MATRDVPALARRARRGRVQGLHDRGRRRHGRARRRPRRSRRRRRPTSPAAGTARPASAARARPRSTASPRLMCMTRLDELPDGQAGDRRADARVPARQGSRHRRLVELRGEEEDQAVQAAAARRAGRHLAHAAGGHRPRPGVPQVHRVLPLPGRVPRAARPPQARRVHRPAASRPRRRARDAPARHGRPRRRTEGDATASATATSPSAARRCAPSTSRSPTTRSSRSRSAWSIGSTIRSHGCCACSHGRS